MQLDYRTEGRPHEKKRLFFITVINGLRPPLFFIQVRGCFGSILGGFRSSFGRFSGGPQNKSKVARTFLKQGLTPPPVPPPLQQTFSYIKASLKASIRVLLDFEAEGWGFSLVPPDTKLRLPPTQTSFSI